LSESNSQFVEGLTPTRHEQALVGVTRCTLLIAMGLAMYVASFFLWAVGDFLPRSSPLRGYFCAEFALVFPFNGDGRSLLHEKPIEYFSLLGSGLINPVFLTTFFLQFFRVRPRAIVVLRNLTILMIPLCWIVFRYERFYPREGHFLWVAGMLLTFFAMSNLQVKSPKGQRA
jgi:hypothetical protein